MSSLEIIDAVICLERAAEGASVCVVPALSGEGPVFSLRDETRLDRIKKALFIAKDYRVFKNDALDARYFINDYPKLLWKLDDDTLARIAALPLGSTFHSDGRAVTVRLPAGASDAAISEAVEIARAIDRHVETRFSLFTTIPGAQRQPRDAWDHRPVPQFVIRELRVVIDVELSWGGPATRLSTPNTRSVAKGIASVEGDQFTPYDDDDAPLIEALTEARAHELAPQLGATVSLHSSMNDAYLHLNLFSEVDASNVLAGVELLARLAAPKSAGPFR